MSNKSDIFEADGTDKFFIALKDEVNPECAKAKILTQNLWEETHSYLDSNLANELRSQFPQRFWEMYLVAVLLDSGKELEKGRSEGPDICIKSADLPKIWVEAVAVSPGNGANAVQESMLEVVRSVPDDPIKLRLLSVFNTKSKQFKKYREKNLICDEEPCVIAINAAQVPSVILDDYDVPRIVKSLLPLGNPTITVNSQTSAIIDSSYAYQDSVSKASGIQIETTHFVNPEYSGISAVIYSHVDVFNLSHEMLLFHNPLARNPLPLGFLRSGYEYWFDKDGEYTNKNWNTI
ncbi:MAG: hypothetical protein WCA07_10310 [Gloeobacterales cyanobacterium]